MKVNIGDDPQWNVARSLLRRAARCIAESGDCATGFPNSKGGLQRLLRNAEVREDIPISAVDLSELGMAAIGQIRVATIEGGRALIMLGRFRGDEAMAEVISKLEGEDVEAGDIRVALGLDGTGEILEEDSPRVHAALVGLRVAAR